MHDPADDWRLLKDFAERGSQDAFAVLVNRHLSMVHSAALRQVRGDQHLAEDVTQATFIALSQKAKQLSPRGPLAVWLLRATHFAARNAIKMESRRRRHELQAAEEQSRRQIMSQPSSSDDVAPAIDRALLQLRRADSEVLVLRYFRGMNLDETAAALSISKTTAAKRVSRALERLGGILREQGCASLTTAGLSGWLASETLHSAPAALGQSVLTAISAGSAPVAVTTLTQGIFKMMMLAKLKFAVVCGAVAALCLTVGVITLAQINAPPPPAVPTVTISGAEWMEDMGLSSGLQLLLANTTRPIYRPRQRADDMDEVTSATITEDQANDAANHGLIMRITDPTDPEPHRIAVYFFPIEHWPSPATFVTTVEANRLSGLNLPPGKYLAIAIDGGWNNFQTIGLPIEWPKPLDIVEGKIARTEFRMSVNLSRNVRRSMTADRGIQNLNSTTIPKTNLSVFGRVTNALGTPFAGADVQVRQVAPGARSIAAPDMTTNSQGYFGLGPVDYSYRVGGMMAWPMLDLPGYRWRYFAPNEIMEGRREVNIAIPDWSKQTGTVKGRLTDADGRDVDAFLVFIESGFWPEPGTPDLPAIDNWGMRAGFTNGHFEFKDVPAGPFKLYINQTARSKQFAPGNGIMHLVRRDDLGVHVGEVLNLDLKIDPQQVPTFPPGTPGGGGGRGR